MRWMPRPNPRWYRGARPPRTDVFRSPPSMEGGRAQSARGMPPEGKRLCRWRIRLRFRCGALERIELRAGCIDRDNRRIRCQRHFEAARVVHLRDQAAIRERRRVAFAEFSGMPAGCEYRFDRIEADLDPVPRPCGFLR